MIRLATQLIPLLALLMIQVSFINALPFPFDRIPLILIVTVYLYQYANRTGIWWWLICYGFLLDVLMISSSPLETISYALVSLILVFLAQRVFTNKSLYSVMATVIISLLVLSGMQLFWIASNFLLGTSYPLWKETLMANLWGGVFSIVLLLLILPVSTRVLGSVQKLMVKLF
jgi:rod shape-determining protein MreD